MRLSVIAIIFAVTLCHAQSSTPAGVDRKGVARIEDSLASQFQSIRTTAGLRHLARIKNRTQLLQMTCTASVNGEFKQPRAVFYKTSNPLSPDPLFEQIAKFDAGPQKAITTPGPKFERFAITVWPTQTQGVYWVGVGLYLSAAAEWFELHLTDDHYYGNLWKKRIVRECKDAK